MSMAPKRIQPRDPANVQRTVYGSGPDVFTKVYGPIDNALNAFDNATAGLTFGQQQQRQRGRR